jgi:ribosomal protein S12 methylthiotransferase
MELAAEISAERLANKVGRTIKVLIDRIEDGVAFARSASDAPEIDGVVRIASAGKLKVGEFAQVEIIAAGAYDLEAHPAG